MLRVVGCVEYLFGVMINGEEEWIVIATKGKGAPPIFEDDFLPISLLL